MWKIVAVLLLTALAMLMAGLAYDAGAVQIGAGILSIDLLLDGPTRATPPLMYAGVRG